MRVVTYKNTSYEIERARPSMAILGVGGLEYISDDLPLGTNLLLVGEIARCIADVLDARTYLLPVFPFGLPARDRRGSGTLTVRYQTLMNVIRDVVCSLYAQGIRQVVIINGLGKVGGNKIIPYGNLSVKTSVRQINYEFLEGKTIWLQPVVIAQQELIQILGSPKAGLVERALMLKLQPQLVKDKMEVDLEQATAVLNAIVQRSAEYINRTLANLAAIKGGIKRDARS